MGFLRERMAADGSVRYVALYRDIRGKQRSAGTFTNKKLANKAWQRAEGKVAEGRAGDPRRGRQAFERYVRDEWLPNHVMEHRTRESYTYYLDRVILPEFGPMKMVEILPSHVREWVSKLQKGWVDAPGPRGRGRKATVSTSPKVIKNCMVILSAIFTTALNDQVTHLHPCKGVKTPPVPKKVREIITPEQFEALHQALPENMQLLVEADVESGLRWGELTDLRVRDFNRQTRSLTVSRVVVELAKPFRVDGQRFVVKEYPKDKEHRRLRLSQQVSAKICEHIDAHALGPDDLLFAMSNLDALGKPRLRAVPDTDALGLTAPNEKGRQYRHGTMTAYGMAPCRCRSCKDAYAIYRAQRRSEGKDHPRRPRTVTTDADGHIPRSWFRDQVWRPACDQAALPVGVRVHDLRHAHASWLLAGGADLQVVKERLGHASIVTTQRYLHSLPEADDAALDAFAKIRHRGA
jgi:integrase